MRERERETLWNSSGKKAIGFGGDSYLRKESYECTLECCLSTLE